MRPHRAVFLRAAHPDGPDCVFLVRLRSTQKKGVIILDVPTRGCKVGA